MSTHKVCLPEIMRIWAQWFGLGLAAIPCGILFGLLLKSGMTQAVALAFALPAGFILGIIAWIVIGRWIVVKPVEYTMCVSFDTISLDRDSLDRAAGAFAVVMLCITLHSAQAHVTNYASNAISSIPHAISER